MYEMGGGDDDDYDKTPRMSLTQAYRRNNNVRPPLSSMSGQRRIAINNGNHPIYKVRYLKLFSRKISKYISFNPPTIQKKANKFSVYKRKRRGIFLITII